MALEDIYVCVQDSHERQEIILFIRREQQMTQSCRDTKMNEHTSPTTQSTTYS
jgi:hypothetical protein